MAEMTKEISLLQQLLDLHAVDQKIREAEDELSGNRNQLDQVADGVAGLESQLERVTSELERARVEARSAERAADDKRLQLDRIRTRVNQVRNEKQYSAASLEFDLTKQDLRKLEDQAIDRMQVVEELESRKSGIEAELDVARDEMGPLAQDLESRSTQLGDEVAILRDRRNNLAIRIDGGALSLYNRIRAGRSQIALAPLTDEKVCGHCFTSVTVQQEMQIREMTRLICCEGCGVILYPGDLKP
jgi:predicted  nucleic acid-binding Zn-ribbon protein